MKQTKRYSEALDTLLARLKLMESGGVEYVGLGPARALEILFETLTECRLCPIHNESHSIAGINMGNGATRAEVAFLLDRDIDSKDPENEPSRELLEKIINAMGLKTNEVYITSVVKCSTDDPETLTQHMEEALKNCRPFLLRELDHISPAVVVALGPEATDALVDTPLDFDSIRGRFQEIAATTNRAGFQIMPTHHPSVLLKAEEKKKETWGDLKKVMAKLKLTR